MTSTTENAIQAPKVGIVVLNYHGTSDTLKCLDSLKAVNPETAFTIVVDNASTPDPTSQFTQTYPWATVIRRDDNGGWAGGNNTGIRHALEHGADWVLLLNNDTTVAPRIVDRLLAAARHHPDCGILGPVICAMDEPETVLTDGCRFNHPGIARLLRADRRPHRGRRPAAGRSRRDRQRLLHDDRQAGLRADRPDRRAILPDPRGSRLLPAGAPGRLRLRDRGRAAGLAQAFRRLCPRRHEPPALLRCPQPLLAAPQSPGNPPRRPARFASWLEYLKYVYYRFSIEREQGQEKAADAVLIGLCDALAGRFGPQGPPPRAALAILRHVFRTGHALRGGRPGDTISPMRFLFVKPRLAWPRSSGHDVHCYHLMKALAEQGHALGLATVAESPPEAVAGLPLELHRTLGDAR